MDEVGKKSHTDTNTHFAVCCAEKRTNRASRELLYMLLRVVFYGFSSLSCSLFCHKSSFFSYALWWSEKRTEHFLLYDQIPTTTDANVGIGISLPPPFLFLPPLLLLSNAIFYRRFFVSNAWIHLTNPHKYVRYSNIFFNCFISHWFWFVSFFAFFSYRWISCRSGWTEISSVFLSLIYITWICIGILFSNWVVIFILFRLFYSFHILTPFKCGEKTKPCRKDTAWNWMVKNVNPSQFHVYLAGGETVFVAFIEVKR